MAEKTMKELNEEMEKIVQEMMDTGGMSLSDFTIPCPTRKINMDPEDPKHVTGMALLLCEDIKEMMQCDLDNLYDNTFISIDRCHLLDCICVIDGIMQMYKESGICADDVRIEFLTKLANIGIVTYKNFKSRISTILAELYQNTGVIPDSKIMGNFEYIINNVWFMTYQRMDTIALEAAEQYENLQKGDKK